MIKEILLVGLIIISLAAFANAGRGGSDSGDIILKAVPEQTNWIADGTTEYRVDVYADNTGLNGLPTTGASWRIVPPLGLENTIIITNAQWPTQNDFFEGFSVFFQIIGINWNLHGKVVWGNGPSNRTGYLASYWFKVNPGFNGQTSFDFQDVEFNDPQANLQPYHIEYVPFNVVTMPTPYGLATQVSAVSVNKTCPSFPVC